MKEESYLPVRASTDNEDEATLSSFKEAQMSLKRPSNRLRNCAFLVIPAVISAVTALVLLILANSINNKVGAGHGHANKEYCTPHPDHSNHPGYHGYDPLTWSQAGRHCGSTAEEARAKGCIFDTISFAWLMPECYDAELVEEFSHIPYKFNFYTTKEKETAVAYPWSEVEKGERAMYVPWSHHLWHCGFLYKKMHRAIMAGKPVDSYIGNFTHTEHCMHLMIVENIQHDLNDLNTIMELKFPYCGPGNLQWLGGTNFTKTHPELVATVN